MSRCPLRRRKTRVCRCKTDSWSRVQRRKDVFWEYSPSRVNSSVSPHPGSSLAPCLCCALTFCAPSEKRHGRILMRWMFSSVLTSRWTQIGGNKCITVILLLPQAFTQFIYFCSFSSSEWEKLTGSVFLLVSKTDPDLDTDPEPGQKCCNRNYIYYEWYIQRRFVGFFWCLN